MDASNVQTRKVNRQSFRNLFLQEVLGSFRRQFTGMHRIALQYAVLSVKECHEARADITTYIYKDAVLVKDQSANYGSNVELGLKSLSFLIDI